MCATCGARCLHDQRGDRGRPPPGPVPPCAGGYRHFAARRPEAPDLLLCPLPRSPTLSVALRSRSADGSAQPVSAARAPCRAFGCVLGDPATHGSASQARGRPPNPGRSTGPNCSRLGEGRCPPQCLEARIVSYVPENGLLWIGSVALAVAGALSIAAESDPATESAETVRPNVVLITVDTLRADHLSSYGYHLRTSPNMDQLARDGLRFDRAYTPIPMTGPAHFSMFTGRYPQEHGVRINGVALPDDSKWLTVPQVLRRFGYTSGAFVSAWPLIGRLTRLHRDFDYYDEELGRSYQVFHSMRWAEDVTRPALRWLDDHKDTKNLFLWVHYFDPHEPYNLREEFADPEQVGEPHPQAPEHKKEVRERIRRYDSEIGYADMHIGRLLSRIDRLGMRDNTLVVLLSDHGEGLGEHGFVGHGRCSTKARPACRGSCGCRGGLSLARSLSKVSRRSTWRRLSWIWWCPSSARKHKSRSPSRAAARLARSWRGTTLTPRGRSGSSPSRERRASLRRGSHGSGSRTPACLPNRQA